MVHFLSRRRFSSKKRRLKSFLQKFLLGTFDGVRRASTSTGAAAGGTTTGGLI
jgi:hypothetical protein